MVPKLAIIYAVKHKRTWHPIQVLILSRFGTKIERSFLTFLKAYVCSSKLNPERKRAHTKLRSVARKT